MPAYSHQFPPHLLRLRLQGLYIVTDAALGGGHLALARAGLEGGACVVQLRDKHAPVSALLPIARALRAMSRRCGALFIINDRLDLALTCGADGVHLGPDDMPVAAARRALGPHRLIGASCSSPEEAVAAQRAGADYIGAGAVFTTGTKHDAGVPIGPAGLAAIVQATPLPVAAIGGIGRHNLGQLREARPAMVSVVSAIADAGGHEQQLQASRHLVHALGLWR